MSRREDMNRHHTIRHTYVPPPRRKISTMFMIMIIVVAAMGINALNKTPTNTSHTASSSVPASDALPNTPPPTREQLFEIATTVAGGQWGPELMDNCILLAKGLGADGDTDAASYAVTLASGGEPSGDTDKVIEAIALDSQQAEVYRSALRVSYQNRLLVKSSK